MLKQDGEDYSNHAKLNFITILYGFYSSQAAVQVVCCACKCHSEMDELKKEKMRLQIRLLKKKLEE